MIGKHYFQISAWLRDKVGAGLPSPFPPARRPPQDTQPIASALCLVVSQGN